MARLRLIISLLALTAGLLAPAAKGQDTKRQEARKSKLQKEIAILDKQIKAAERQSGKALGTLSLLGKKLASRKALISESDAQIDSFSYAISLKNKKIKALEGRLDTLSGHYSRLLKTAYKNRNPKLWYLYILASENISQGLRRYAYFRDMASQLNKQGQKVRQAKDSLSKEKEELGGLLAQTKALRARRMEEARKLQGEESSARELVGRLQKDKKSYRQQLERKRREVAALDREIARLVREALAKSSKPSKAKGGKPAAKIDYTLSGEFAANKGKLPWPASGPVIETFGQHNHPVFSNVRLPFSNGITLALDKGAPVSCVFDGEVRQIVLVPGYGKCVLVQHGEYFSFYCKLGTVYVKPGTKIKTGQTIGLAEEVDGSSQLHFQLWKGRAPQNPELWLRP